MARKIGAIGVWAAPEAMLETKIWRKQWGKAAAKGHWETRWETGTIPNWSSEFPAWLAPGWLAGCRLSHGFMTQRTLLHLCHCHDHCDRLWNQQHGGDLSQPRNRQSRNPGSQWTFGATVSQPAAHSQPVVCGPGSRRSGGGRPGSARSGAGSIGRWALISGIQAGDRNRRPRICARVRRAIGGF